MKTGVRLVDGSRELVLHPSLDYVPQRLTVSSPAIRETTELRTDDDGERDTTELFGARAVSLELAIVDEQTATEVLIDQVKRFLHPRSRPYLHVTDDGWDQERRIRLRVDQWDEPYEGYAAAYTRPIQLQWRAPDGVWETVDPVEVTVVADVDSGGVGFALPFTLPLSLAATAQTGAAVIGNVGSVPSHFTARLYGPCAGPALRNETTGEEIAFTTSLVLAAGEYVDIDTRDRSANLLSTSNSRLQYVDFTTTSWWRLEPGDNQVRYAPQVSSPGAQAVITYRPAWF
jgi:hypothetical protein